MKFQQLTEANFVEAAEALGCEVAAVKAVAEVESPRGAFVAPGKATILFEAHIFARYTRNRYNATHPDISSARWNRALYKGGLAEWDRYAAAAALDETAAQMAISMGAFQIMGFNFAIAGFRTVAEFFYAMNLDEFAQLSAFVRLIQSNRLDDELREKRWADFARLYNGERYRENKYDQKIAVAYAKAAQQTPLTRPRPIDAAATIEALPPQVTINNTADDTTMKVKTETPGQPGQPPQVTTTTATVETAHVSDSQKSVRAGISAATVITILTSVGQWLKGNANLVMVSVICITALTLVFMFRQLILAAIREWLKGNNINVNP